MVSRKNYSLVNYYELLQVPRTANTEEIRLAYRKQLLRWHPDKNANSPTAEEMTKTIAEGYHILTEIALFERDLALYFAINRALEGNGTTIEQIEAIQRYRKTLPAYLDLSDKKKGKRNASGEIKFPLPAKPDGDVPLDGDVLKALIAIDKLAREKFRLE